MAITRIGNIASTIPDDSIQNAKFSNIVQSKNIIINGDMSIAQRGTSFTGLGDTDSQYTLDRFKWSEEGSSGTAEFTITQSTDVPTGQGFATSLKLDCTTADTSIDSGNIIYIEQRVEGQNLQYLKYGTSSAESTTLSFWVKSNKTGTYTVNALGDIAGSGKLYSQAYTISSADTWEKKTLTFIGDTALAINNNSSNGLQLMWNLLAGTSKSSGSLQTWGSNTQANRAPGQVNLADSTSNELYITGIQWEAGTTASDFEFLPFDVNLDRCIRYYTTSQGKDYWGSFAPGDENAIFGDRLDSFSNVPVNHRFPKRMRATPTVTTYSLTGTSGSCSNTGTTAGSHSANDACGTARVSESGIGYLTGVNNSAGDGLAFQYEADAEL
ncbi:hypothetical protein N9M14_02525 [Candidatus Pelagibacter bacterium]|nr:hypothetical protein [Candidatus Pelagibacter bacterium]